MEKTALLPLWKRIGIGVGIVAAVALVARVGHATGADMAFSLGLI